MPEKLWKKDVFCLYDTITVPGYTRGDHWNGWECPAFDKDVADRILAKLYDQWSYRAPGDVFVANDPHYDKEEWTGFDITLENGEVRHVYAIGAYSWVWMKEAGE